MAAISLTPDQLRSQSRVYLEARSMVEEAKSKAIAANNEMAEQWKGQAFQAYLAQFDELSAHIVKFNDLLSDIYEQLNKYANTVEERDQQDAQSFGFN